MAGEAAYGSSFWPLLWNGLLDRLKGDHARANARWGHLQSLSEQQKKVVWIKCGSDLLSIKLALGLLQSIRQKRYDLLLLLTFEEEYAELITTAVQGLKGVVIAYGPCDHPRAVKRVLQRIKPLGVILVEPQHDKNLLLALGKQQSHVLVVGEMSATQVNPAIEAIYPQTKQQQVLLNEKNKTQLIPAADLLTLLTHAHVEPVLKGSISNGELWCFYWLHGVAIKQLTTLLDNWKNSSLSEQGILFISASQLESSVKLKQSIEQQAFTVISLDQWQTTELKQGLVVLVDSWQWAVKVAASVSALHLLDYQRDLYWLGLSLGSNLSLSPQAAKQCAYAEELNEQQAVAEISQLLHTWQLQQSNPFASRKRVDWQRNRFWQERRAAQLQVDELLTRVFDW